MNPTPRRGCPIRNGVATALSYSVGIALGAVVGGFVGWGIAGRVNELTGLDTGHLGPVLGALVAPGLVVRRLWTDPGEEKAGPDAN